MPALEQALIYKSNSLVEASYRLSVIEQRIILACVSQVRRNETITDEVMYSVSAKDLAVLSETDEKTAYRDLKEAALRLKRREVRIEKETNSKKRRTQTLVCGWVQSIMYVEDEGRVCLRFNKDMLPYLSRLTEQFTKYQLKAVARMDSAYAIRIYELLSQWRDKQKREMEIAWLRTTLQIGDKYPAIKDFKKRVIEPAVAQINEHSDLTVSYTQRKTGRNVTHLTFIFAPKAGTKPNETVPEAKDIPTDIRAANPPLETDENFSRLLSVGVHADTARELIQGYDGKRIQQVLDYSERKNRENTVKNLAGFVVQGIRKGFRDEEAEKREQAAAEAKRKQEEERSKKRMEALAGQYKEYGRERAREYLATLDEGQISVLWEEFYNSHDQATQNILLKRKGNIAKDMFLSYVRKKLPVPDFGEWLEKNNAA
ncbi:MAG: RepB family plasmid replication initiator protein [Gallionella sp.]|nr:MAG: RepB family plasmid replication initiator protein [Gallionella sp.]